MRALFVVASGIVVSIFACSSSHDAEPAPEPTNVDAPVRDAGSSASSSSSSSSGSTDDAAPGGDAAPEASVPAVQFIGRFDLSNANAPKTAWPGARIIAKFSGTGVKATLTHVNGNEGGTTWMNVIVDGASKAPIEVTGASQQFTLASGLAAGDHVVELQKRTEANVGTLTFEGFTFDGGGQLLVPPPRATRRIEFLADSTIDGYGVDGTLGDVATCDKDGADGAPVQFNDPRKSIAFLTAEALSAEHHLLAYSGKGLVRNEDSTTTGLFGSIFGKTLPDAPTSAWTFASWVPDAVVVSLGGSDCATTNSVPNGLQAGFAALLADIRAKYGAGPRVVFLVWSQLKDYDAVTIRTDVSAAIDGAIAGDAKASRFTLPEAQYPADETGCQFHANAAHHQAMSALLVTELEAKMGW